MWHIKTNFVFSSSPTLGLDLQSPKGHVATSNEFALKQTYSSIAGAKQIPILECYLTSNILNKTSVLVDFCKPPVATL